MFCKIVEQMFCKIVEQMFYEVAVWATVCNLVIVVVEAVKLRY